MAANYAGPERRCERPGRRAIDFETCMFHEGTCKNLEEIWKVLKGKAPTWVMMLLVTIAIATFGGFGWMLRDTSQSVREIAGSINKLERSQAVVLYHLKLKME
jgi:hypothetical protein